MRPSLVCRPAVGGLDPPKARAVGEPCKADEPCRTPRSAIPIERRVESFADDLNTRRGIVSGRVALLPRSTEIQPLSLRFVPPHPNFYKVIPSHQGLTDPILVMDYLAKSQHALVNGLVRDLGAWGSRGLVLVHDHGAWPGRGA